MKYDISSSSAPAMPKLGRGTECIKLLLSQASKEMHEPFVPMFFPIFGAHISGTVFKYPDNSWKEPTGMMANLVAHSGDNKGQLTNLADAICHEFTKHDKEEENRYLTWQRQKNAKGANKDKPEEPQLAYWYPPSNTTSAAFLKNAIALEAQGDHTQYFNMPEVEMADQLCGGHKQVSVLLRNVYDRARAGALRATADGITGNPIIRACLTLSSNPKSTRKFYKNELTNGTFGRMVFSYKVRGERKGKIPRQGNYDDEFYEKLDEYLARLAFCKGRYIIRPLNKLIDKLAEDMATLADLTDDDLLFEISHRSLVSAWKAGCILWVLNDQTWTKAMAELVEWLVYHDLWSKITVFGDMLAKEVEQMNESQRRGPVNMLKYLPNCALLNWLGRYLSMFTGQRRGPVNMLKYLPNQFNKAQLEALRESQNKPIEGASNQLRKWLHRKFITYCSQTGLYTKTEEYLKKLKN